MWLEARGYLTCRWLRDQYYSQIVALFSLLRPSSYVMSINRTIEIATRRDIVASTSPRY